MTEHEISKEIEILKARIQVLALGQYAPADLKVSVSESTRNIDPAVDAQLEAIWEAKKKKADEAGKICYNGLSYRLNSLEKIEGTTGSKLALDFGIIEYKVRDGLLDIPEYFNLPEPFYRKGCYSMASVRTAEGIYLMAELSGKSMNKNPTDLLGGVMETKIEAKTGGDVFQAILSELEEEACVHRADIEKIYLRAVFLSSNTNICFYYEAILTISALDLQHRFKDENKDQDIKSLKYFSHDEYLAALKNHNSKNKQFIPEILSI